MVYLSVLGRQPEISLAELQAIFSHVKQISSNLATFELSAGSSRTEPSISRLGGSLKLAVKLEQPPIQFLQNLPEGKITIGISDYSKNASVKTAKTEALKLKKILVRHERSVRIVENQSSALSTATALHNGLSGKNARKIEFIKYNNTWYKTIGIQDIDAYTKRDQARPARDAKVGMLPPKLAQILINLCGPLPQDSTILDPFCGTGVVLQEALLMGYHAYGTDLSERMVEYSKKNLIWLKNIKIANTEEHKDKISDFVAVGAKQGDKTSNLSPHEASETCGFHVYKVEVGDAVNYKWAQPINAIACEGYLGRPFSIAPSDIALKEQKQECGAIALGFLKNLVSQIKSNTPVVIAVPAWLRPDGKYERLDIIDEIENMGYNVNNKMRAGLLYHRNDQVVARDILILRKK